LSPAPISGEREVFAPFYIRDLSEDDMPQDRDAEKLGNDPMTAQRVDYKQPPRESQFKRGRSGNPAGRPKRIPSFARALADELAEQVVIREGDVDLRTTKQRALVRSLVATAIAGDAKIAKLLIEICERQSATEDADTVADDEELFINRLVAEKVESEPRDE
jgi:hypothetical protein